MLGVDGLEEEELKQLLENNKRSLSTEWKKEVNPLAFCCKLDKNTSIIG